MSENQMTLIAFRFSFVGHERAETFKIYARNIRGFLRVHRTEAVWIKGGVGRREAFLIMADLDSVKTGYVKMMAERTETGYWTITPYNPFDAIKNYGERKELTDKKLTEGYLNYDSVELGDPDVNYCPPEKYEHVSVQNDCMKGKHNKPCFYWNGTRCTWSPDTALNLSAIAGFEFAINRLTEEEAKTWIEERKQKGDHSKYVIEKRTDSPMGEEYFRVSRVIYK